MALVSRSQFLHLVVELLYKRERSEQTEFLTTKLMTEFFNELLPHHIDKSDFFIRYNIIVLRHKIFYEVTYTENSQKISL